MLQITLKRIGTNSTHYPAEHLLDAVEVMIGGQKVFEFDHEWFRVYYALYLNRTQQVNYDAMCDFTGLDPDKYQKTLYLPIPLWFNGWNLGMALPLVALQHHDVELRFKFSEAKDIPDIDTTFTPKIRCYADYVFLDMDERLGFVRYPRDYVMMQVQRNAFPITIDTTMKKYKVPLNFKHPVQYIMWMVRPNSYSHGIYSSSSTLSGETNDTYAPLAFCKMSINGTERMTFRPGRYYTTVQTWTYSDGDRLDAGMYLYNFGAEIKFGVPTGTLNFSRVDNVTLHLETKAAVVDDAFSPGDVDETMTLKTSNALSELLVFAVNFNVLRIRNGVGGIVFSN